MNYLETIRNVRPPLTIGMNSKLKSSYNPAVLSVLDQKFHEHTSLFSDQNLESTQKNGTLPFTRHTQLLPK